MCVITVIDRLRPFLFRFQVHERCGRDTISPTYFTGFTGQTLLLLELFVAISTAAEVDRAAGVVVYGELSSLLSFSSREQSSRVYVCRRARLTTVSPPFSSFYFIRGYRLFLHLVSQTLLA